MSTTSSVSEVLTNTKQYTNSVSVNKIKNTKTLKQVTHIANAIAERLNNPSRFKLYCKYAWKLSESQLWNNLEQATNARSPQRLFTFLCEKELAE